MERYLGRFFQKGRGPEFKSQLRLDSQVLKSWSFVGGYGARIGITFTENS